MLATSRVPWSASVKSFITNRTTIWSCCGSCLAKFVFRKLHAAWTLYHCSISNNFRNGQAKFTWAYEGMKRTQWTATAPGCIGSTNCALYYSPMLWCTVPVVSQYSALLTSKSGVHLRAGRCGFCLIFVRLWVAGFPCLLIVGRFPTVWFEKNSKKYKN